MDLKLIEYLLLALFNICRLHLQLILRKPYLIESIAFLKLGMRLLKGIAVVVSRKKNQAVKRSGAEYILKAGLPVQNNFLIIRSISRGLL